MSKAKLRGLVKVEIQFLLTATVINLKKMLKMIDTEPLRHSLDKKLSYFIQFKNTIFRKRIIKFAT